MNTCNTKKWIILSAMTFCLSLSSLTAGITSEAKKTFKDYFQECPYIGLIADKITYGPITISEVNIHDGNKLAIVSPEETLKGSLRYKVDSKDLHMLHLYHMVIGIKGAGAQDCITHSLGFWDSKGKGNFTLVAPEKPGIYEVRFLFTDAATCDEARHSWKSGLDVPSSAATVGIIIVE